MKQDIVVKFVEAINNQNLSLIIDMMSEDFYFIDTYGNKENKEQMKIGWQGYFNWFPDYLIEIYDYIESDKFSIIIGKASASYLGNKEKYCEFPACWKVIIKGNQIQTWQVFCDSKKQLDSMKQIVGEKAAVFISHRLSSCRFCERILVFDKGQIVQCGTHDALLKEQMGKYYELWKAQAQYYQ